MAILPAVAVPDLCISGTLILPFRGTFRPDRSAKKRPQSRRIPTVPAERSPSFQKSFPLSLSIESGTLERNGTIRMLFYNSTA